MRQSEINAGIARAIDLITANRWSLPPWGLWGAAEFVAAANPARVLPDHQRSWDATDFGSDGFARRGLTQFCARNGRQNEANGKPYAEKLLIVGEEQDTPVRRHRVKMEDIINRAGGALALEFAPVRRKKRAWMSEISQTSRRSDACDASTPPKQSLLPRSNAAKIPIGA